MKTLTHPELHIVTSAEQFAQRRAAAEYERRKREEPPGLIGLGVIIIAFYAGIAVGIGLFAWVRS